MFNGVFTALATPFLSDGHIDFDTLKRLLQAQLQAGVQGLVLLGTTAETPTLSAEEKKQIFAKEIRNKDRALAELKNQKELTKEIERVKGLMYAASKQLDFEQAIELREQLNALRKMLKEEK